jgi:AraC-like DNA-binding protein
MDPTIENYFRYIPESKLCHTLGCTLQSSGHTVVQPFSEYPSRTHPEDHLFNRSQRRVLQAYQIVFISKGRGRVELGAGNRNQSIRAGQVFVLFPKIWHRYSPHPATGWTEHWVECKGTAFDMATSAGLLDSHRPVFRNTNFEAITDTFTEIHQLARDDAVSHQPVLSMLGLKLLAILAGPRNANEHSTNKLVNSVRMLLLERCTESHSMEEIAEELNVSYSNLRRTFRVNTGMSMKDYQMSMRMQKAKDLLDNTDLSVKGVAAELGFNSPFHFSSQFRNYTGSAPTDWRARIRRDHL